MHKNRLGWRGQLAKAAILYAAILFSFGLGNSAAWPQAVSQDPAVERGLKQFQQSCGFCHGPDATGARWPDLVYPLWPTGTTKTRRPLDGSPLLFHFGYFSYYAGFIAKRRKWRKRTRSSGLFSTTFSTAS